MLLSRFSRVQLLATPWTAAYQAPPSMGFARQEYWSGLPLPSPKGWRVNEMYMGSLCTFCSILLYKAMPTGPRAYGLNISGGHYSVHHHGRQVPRIWKKFRPKVRRRQWHPTPVLLPGKSHGRRSLVGCSPWGR